MAAATGLVRLLQRRPFATLSLGGAAGLSGLAYAVEWRSERQQFLQDNENNNDENVQSLPRTYQRDRLQQYWAERPVTTCLRLWEVTAALGPRAGAYLWDFWVCRALEWERQQEEEEALQHQHARKLREALTKLGPAFVKAGQQLSIRPDLVPPPVLRELQKLCDAVEPVPDQVAMNVLREELQCDDLNQLFEGMHLVASASLGQVYKAKRRDTGQDVAIKVQRPDMLKSFSLDLYLLQKLGVVLDAVVTTLTHQAPYHQDLFDTFSRGSYSELDYENEASNQIRFQSELAKRRCKVKIPSVHTEYTSQRVITTEWIEGVKLADASQEKVRQLIPVGVELFLTQLLDIGAFHADPHVGNLYVTGDGTLCLLDFGLCAEVDEKSRRAMTKAIVHLLTGDFDSLVSQDAKELGFLPEDMDTSEIKPILTKILTQGLLEPGSNIHNRKRKLMEISNELNEIFFRYPFSVPPFFALVTRGLGLLEGIALSGDPDFDIFQASYPYARRRAVQMMGYRSLERMKRRATANV